MKALLVVNDLHIPFQRDDILDVIESCKDKIGIIVFGGDVIDCKSISSFPSLDDMTIEYELKKAIEFIHKVREIVGSEVKLRVMKGNHEMRWERYISKMHDKKLYKFINPNVLEVLKEGMTLYEDDKAVFIEGDKELEVVSSWYTIYNKVLICHPTNYYSQPMKNGIVATQFFSPREDFEVLICAHSHHQGTCFFGGKWVIESGCCCKEMQYIEGKTKVRPQDYGVVYIEFGKDNRVDINNSMVVRLEPEAK